MEKSAQQSTTVLKESKKKNSNEFEDFDVQAFAADMADAMLHNLNENAKHNAPEYPGQAGYAQAKAK